MRLKIALVLVFCVVRSAFALTTNNQYRATPLGFDGRTTTNAVFLNDGAVAVSVTSEAELDPENEQQLVRSKPAELWIHQSEALRLLITFDLNLDMEVRGGINSNLLVGWFNNHSTGEGSAALFEQGAITKIGPPGSQGSYGKLINSQGQVIMSARFGQENLELLREPDGTFINLSTPLGHFIAGDLNDAGDIVGVLHRPEGKTSPVLRRQGGLQVLGTNNLSGSASGINNRGQIVGGVQGFDGVGHAAILIPGSDPILLDSSDFYSSALDISEEGTIIGAIISADGLSHAALFSVNHSPLILQDLLVNPTGWERLMYPTSIDENRRIVGKGIYQGSLVGFLLTPVPEPTTASIVVLVVLSVYAVKFRSTRVGIS